MKDHPIRRLDLLIKEMLKQPVNMNCRQALSEVLDIEDEDKEDLLYGYADILQLAEEALELADTIDSVEKEDLYVIHVKKARGILRSINFESSWSEYAKKFDPVTMHGIRVCIDVTSRVPLNDELDPKAVDELLQQLDNTVSIFRSSSIPEELKQAIIDRLGVVGLALTRYKYFGNSGLSNALEILTGATLVRMDEILTSAKDESAKSVWDKLFKYLGQLNTAVTANQNIRQIGTFFAGFLSGNA